MITQSIHIKNFKSIKDLQFFPRKINLFIGEPNAGKSNIIEALSLLSKDVIGHNSFNQIVRHIAVGDLFFDHNVSQQIEVNSGVSRTSLHFQNYEFHIENEEWISGQNHNFKARYNMKGHPVSVEDTKRESIVKPYVFKKIEHFNINYSLFLNPPFGDNIPNLLASNNHLKGLVSSFLRDRKFRLNINTANNEILVVKEIEEEIYSFPYFTISETFQRIIFLLLAMESNNDSILVFDEPEANTFPYYTKFIAEQVTFDESNQYFISTHNPYFLSAIVEKAKIEDVAVFITYMDERYQTQLKKINDAQMGQVLDLSSDVFFNLDKFLHE